ncbi:MULTISPECIES: transcription-repair coupling factor [Rhodomicrobium]|uniref:transcription-repair coupling factor n=1 Tax=Rhodomicrobium TaxID=1068 RepID=UPI000B4C0456|nr:MULTISPECIES: transcription-repair coupling factor [Rhodomicrobium]
MLSNPDDQAKPKQDAAPRSSVAIAALVAQEKPLVAAGVPEGFDAYLIARMAAMAHKETATPVAVLHVARDDQRAETLREQLRFFAPGADVLNFPAWDTVPYDRVSPHTEISSRRIATLAQLARLKTPKRPVILITTVNAALQRVPPREAMKKALIKLTTGMAIDMSSIGRRLERWGYRRTGTVMEPGEYAMRGGILDLFPPANTRPARLDFFGDTLEAIRFFDPVSQRTQAAKQQLILMPASELPTGPDVIRRFRERYLELFGGATSDDPLYEAISSGIAYAGAEHWLPLFYDQLETVFDYVPDAVISFDHLAKEARAERIEQIEDHYEARKMALEQASFGTPPYKPVPPKLMFLGESDWNAALEGRKLRMFSPFEDLDGVPGVASLHFGAKLGRNFALERAEQAEKLFDAVNSHIARLQAAGKRVIVAGWTAGARERLGSMLGTHGLKAMEPVDSFAEAAKLSRDTAAFAVLGLESGFETPDLAIIGEQDILGDRLVRRRKARKGSDVLSEASALAPGDLVVHADHGIGRFLGLQAITAAGAPHDCLELEYHGGDKLFLPVENIDLLTRYGSDDSNAQLDRLGGAAWQARKARLKKRIRDIADALIKVAAERELKEAPALPQPAGAYDEFVALFPYEETDDQLSSIEAVIEDLGRGRPMDRLICGDVGFGKTEVALRAAFIAVMAGKQVAVVVPTTLLARQHYKTFTERFKGLPVRIDHASRLVTSKDLATMREGIKSGQTDIVVGTHALLAKSVEFADLGLLIIDEEQHFGVAHKERLKQLKSDVHVLTLTATPIPRTLQLALTGVREMSVIATPPVDRLAVRTFITPFDPVTLREALLRERYRGGQTFYVCPRISDLDEIAAFLREHVPELKFTIAHGQMPPSQLEDVMTAFYDRKFDVLLSTTIVESGLDIPTANTLIVHRADMFGLGQLYQLRGRVGRAKTRAYALFTIPPNQKLTPTAEKRLKVLHSLDSLGAGFSLASHDLDIRGAGNLLGEEQSGHIREVGFELYQQMLEEAVASLREGGIEERAEQWSPQINVGSAVLIPESYVTDLQARLGLYRRLSAVTEREEIENFAAEMVDRFGPLPAEVRHLLAVVQIKGYCRKAGISQVEAGPKGAVISFRGNNFANPAGLVTFINENKTAVKMQQDHKLVFKADWPDADERLKGARNLVRRLAELAGDVKAAA